MTTTAAGGGGGQGPRRTGRGDAATLASKAVVDILVVRIGGVPAAVWRSRLHSTSHATVVAFLSAVVGRGSACRLVPIGSLARAETRVAAFALEDVRSPLELGERMGGVESLDLISVPVGDVVLEGEDLGFGGGELRVALCEGRFERGDLDLQNVGLVGQVRCRGLGGTEFHASELGAAFGEDGTLPHEAGRAILEVRCAVAPEDSAGAMLVGESHDFCGGFLTSRS